MNFQLIYKSHDIRGRSIAHFIAVCFESKPLSGGEARREVVVFLKYKLLGCHVN